MKKYIYSYKNIFICENQDCFLDNKNGFVHLFVFAISTFTWCCDTTSYVISVMQTE